jgi:hypothetical protein
MQAEARPESVMMGRDKDVLQMFIPFYLGDSPRILDCTYNAGVMWKGTPYRPLRMDIDGSFDLDVVADFRKMPFDDRSFDAVVFDPPHLPHAQDSQASTLGWQRQYGCNKTGEGRDGDNVSPLFLPFLLEAKRVLVEDGVVFAKIADLVHNHRYQWQHADFLGAVASSGMTACDLLIKRDPSAGSLKSSKWKKAHHLRRCHCYWFVVRNSQKCEPRRSRAS